ncbi:MAG: phage integrase N-terminal SAM-like domain-containing protein [Parcubacteria group bacterium]|nr:phage integrase N-terminal SAM-like domain-containing protein [Parcubacteria group bacterium]
MKKLSPLITDFLEYLEIEKGRSQATLSNYDFYLKRFARWARNVTPAGVTTDTIRKYRLWLNRYHDPKSGQQLSAKTQNYHLITWTGSSRRRFCQTHRRSSSCATRRSSKRCSQPAFGFPS